MRNPTTHIYNAYWNAIKSLGYNVHTDSIPLDQQLTKNTVILASSDKQQRRLCKTCPESWLVTMTVNVTSINEAGQSNRDEVNDIEGDILNAINECSDLSFDWFKITKTTISNSFNDDLELPTQYMNRQIIRIEHEIYEKDTI